MCVEQRLDRLVPEATALARFAENPASHAIGGDQTLAPIPDLSFWNAASLRDVGNLMGIVDRQTLVQYVVPAEPLNVLQRDAIVTRGQALPKAVGHDLELHGFHVTSQPTPERAVRLLDLYPGQIFDQRFGCVIVESAPSLKRRLHDDGAGGVELQRIESERVGHASGNMVGYGVQTGQELFAKHEQGVHAGILTEFPKLTKELRFLFNVERIDGQNLLELVEHQCESVTFPLGR